MKQCYRENRKRLIKEAPRESKRLTHLMERRQGFRFYHARERWRASVCPHQRLSGPGALVGQQFFRHKTRKTSYQVSFWFNVVLNLAVLCWLLLWPGAEFVRQALEIRPFMLLRF